MKPLIFLTNDDGFYSEGIEALSRHLQDLGETYIVAPDREKSATSLALTLHRPLRVKAIQSNVFAVDGTPADCVYLGLQKLLPRKPSLLVSGMNRGPNLGQQDISYSGTVAAAIQGTYLQVPSLAVSLLPDANHRYFFDFSASLIRSLARIILQHKLPEKVTLNLNIPPPPFKGIKVVRLGEKRYNPEIIEKKDPRENIYYWIGTGQPRAEGDRDSDVMVIKEGYITITPLRMDMTDFSLIQDPTIRSAINSIADEFAQKTL